jgi:uncharacterized membrane protein YfcA
MSKEKSSFVFSTKEEAYKVAHDYAWNWFSYHAQQRLQIFNFGIIVLGALIAACFSSFLQRWYHAATVSAALIAFLGYAFLRLDQRNSELTKLAERYLKTRTEEALSPIVGDEINFATQADKPDRAKFYTFGQIVRGVYFAIISAAIVAFAVGAHHYARSRGLLADYTGLW